MEERSTIAACATPPGRGGVAVIRVSGPEAFAIATALTGRSVTRARAGRFFHASLGGVDDGLVLVFAAPHSYTGEDVVEFQGHGGSVAPRRVLEACLAAGARLARRGEFTERAFLNGKLDLAEAEAVIDLVDARTARAADEALARLSGRQSAPFARLYAQALDLSARAEHALDFSEDELPPDFFATLAADRVALDAALATALATAREGRLLREGALVVLAGAPNAGKSSLMNALLGTGRVLVSDTAGTTRDSIEEGLDVAGWPVRLVDTAGLRAADDAVEAAGVARAEKLIAAADVVLALDCDIPGALRLHAKCDLGPGEGLNVSSRTGEGLDALKTALAARLAALAARGDEETGADVTTRQRGFLERARDALARAAEAPDLAVQANALRAAAEALGQMLGKTYADDLLEALFSRFCIGK